MSWPVRVITEDEDAMARKMEAARLVVDDRAAIVQLVELWLDLFA